jgi:hypothetical protein
MYNRTIRVLEERWGAGFGYLLGCEMTEYHWDCEMTHGYDK